MKKSLLFGILGGAAVGAAASYLWSAQDRENLVSGIKNLGGSVSDMLTGESGSSSSPSASTAGRRTSGSTSSRSRSTTTTKRG